MKLSPTEQEQIVTLFEQGYSSRTIAREVLGRETKKSTVNDFLRSRQLKTPLEASKTLKTLLLDIETSPCISYHWKRWKENIGQDQAISESFILTYAAKWLHDDAILFGNLDSNEVRQESDYRLVKELHALLEEADIIIAHNGYKFDLPVINTRIVYHRLPPPCPYRIVDTYRIAKALFRFPSNSLDALAAYLGVGRKTKTGGFMLWRNYMQGDEEAITTMIEYNIDDVELLEGVYLLLRSWDKKHPNVMPEHDHCCPACGSSNVAQLHHFVYTTNSKFVVYHCRQCQKKFRSKTRIPVSNSFVNIA